MTEFTMSMYRSQADLYAAMNDHIRQLEEALRGITEHYVTLVNSGDAGNWNPEAEPQVIAARRALGEQP